ncbi:hypothetical protein QBC43DRAFT_354864 [Cladorrhinum sp. PSN259]|nr:hypothetical protein QBC43DRAFT_354864 [Cladorrhinum sp. PSN259]
MVRSISLLALLGSAACSAATEIVILPPGSKNLLFAQPAGTAPKGVYTLRHDASNIELPLDFNFPIRSLGINDFRPEPHPSRPHEMVCCPPGTFFDPRTQQCAFLASSICPQGFSLDAATKSICISETPPCPKDLYLDNGRCVSPNPPTCADHAAQFDKETNECIALSPPECDSPLKVEGPNCVSPDYTPGCGFGYRQEDTRCILIAGPSCGPPELGLVVSSDNAGKPICVSKNLPVCPNGSKPDKETCTVITGPKCPKDFQNVEGSCIFKGNLCPQGGVYTTFQDERSPVCRTSEPPLCLSGDLQGTECVSKQSPCLPGYTLTKDHMCTRSERLQCGPNSKVFILDEDDGPQHEAFCCPDIPGMTLDHSGQCSIQLPECPSEMTYDEDQELCVYTPQPKDCETGQLDSETGLCTETTDAKCDFGTPDPVTGKCNLGKPSCPTAGAVFDEETGQCHLTETPTCPEKSKLIAGQCVSDDTSTCPEDAPHSGDKSKCVYKNPPTCPGDSQYHKDLQLCVVPYKPTCDHMAEALGGDTPRLERDGLRCVSPAPPACPPGSGTEFDPETKKCVGKELPKCVGDFQFSDKSHKCVSNIPPGCEHLGPSFSLWEGKCVADTDPICPAQSNWVPSLKACVSDKPPCPENTPTIDGKCVSSEPPRCKMHGTEFQPGVGCVAKNVKPKCIEGTELNDEGECVSAPRCHGKDLVPFNGMCVSKTQKPECPYPTVDRGDGRCVTRTEPECPNPGEENLGLSFDKFSGKCVGAPPKCPDRSQLDGGMAKCITASARTCFALLACPDVVDDLPLLPPTSE